MHAYGRPRTDTDTVVRNAMRQRGVMISDTLWDVV